MSQNPEFIKEVAPHIGKNGRKEKRSLYRCGYCGNEFVTREAYIKCGSTKSCGCQSSKKTIGIRSVKHGYAKNQTSTYRIWNAMKGRCLNKKDHAWPNYGGRGITVCDRWLMFENFLADMGERPDRLTLERLDNSKGYSKENCIWTDRKNQARNRRTSRIIENNNQKRTLVEWEQLTGIKRKTISRRLERGWSIKDALFARPGEKGNGRFKAGQNKHQTTL